MNGYNVYYPMGYDDNGLPTERLVKKRLGITPPRSGRRPSSRNVCKSADAEVDTRPSGSAWTVD
jgi:valyl-tRNA synthetase